MTADLSAAGDGQAIRGNDALARALAYAAFFCSLSGLYVLAGLLLARSGLPTPGMLAPYCATLLVAVAFSPFLRSTRQPEPLAALAVLLLPLLGFANATLALGAAGAVALLGLWRGVPWLRGTPAYAAWFLVVAPPLAALHVFPAEGLLLPFAPELAAFGLLDNASYFQTAVAHVIQLHGVPSIGADGAQLLHYHFGSHFWFAGIALAAGTSPLHAYPFAQLAVLVPLLLFGVCAAASALARPDCRGPALIVICTGLVALFDAFMIRIHYSSESFTFSLVAALLALPAVVRLHEDDRTSAAAAWPWVAALIAVAGIASLKVSTGYVLAAMVSYAAWRRHGTSWPAAAVVAGAAAILLVSQSLFAPRGFYIAHWQVLLASYKQFIVPENFFTLLLPGACGWYAWRGVPSGQSGFLHVLVRYLIARPHRRAQLLLAGSLAAFAPVLLLPIGSNALYFSLMPHWLLLPMVAGFLVSWSGPQSARRPPRQAWAALAILFLTTVPFLPVNRDLNSLRGFLMAVDERAPGSRLLHEPQAMLRFFAANIGRERALFSREFVDKLGADPWSARLKEVAADARVHGRRFAVFVPPSHSEFWNKLAGTGPYWCADMHLYIPSQTGSLMLKGLQPLDQPCGMFAPGSPDYGPASHSAERDDAQLCAHASGIGVSTILILNSATVPEMNRRLVCNASK